MFVKCIPPYTPLLYSENGDCSCISIFLILLQTIDCGSSLEQKKKQEKYTKISDEHLDFLQ